jgi:ferredoxin
MNFDPLLSLYALPLLGVWAIYFGRRWRKERRSIAKREASAEAGLLEPPSLHPQIDPTRCIGCGACVRACPEGDILGLIGGRAELVEPSDCIGHGACRAACPADAIRLVFGTERRGVDIPHVGPDFQTNVPGVFIAGELGGMGLIRNAIEQGRQAIDAVRARGGSRQSNVYDVVIIGGGPAGFSASLAALEHRLRFVTIEQDSFGGTVAHFPRGKLVMTAPAKLPLIGTVKFREVSKEKLLGFWHDAARRTGLRINYGERAESIVRNGSALEVRTTRTSYPTRAVLLAIGRRGTPRRLGVPGEELPKVVYRLVDPAQYRGKHVLVVGWRRQRARSRRQHSRGAARHRHALPPQRSIQSCQAQEPGTRGGGTQAGSAARADAIRGQAHRRRGGRAHAQWPANRDQERQCDRLRRRNSADGISAEHRHRGGDQIWHRLDRRTSSWPQRSWQWRPAPPGTPAPKTARRRRARTPARAASTTRC